MDTSKVGKAMQEGVSIFCATCEKFWTGRKQGLPSPKCVVQKPCGSPLAGLAFPEYEGPITAYTQWCFVCGGRADKGLKVKSSERVIGVCEEHVEMVGNVEPIRLNGCSVEEIVSSVTGGSTLKQFFGIPKPTLGQAIQEAETYFKEQDERKSRR